MPAHRHVDGALEPREVPGLTTPVDLPLGPVQLPLAATAWADLATCPTNPVNGRKAMRAPMIAVNFVDPLAYFASGRRCGR